LKELTDIPSIPIHPIVVFTIRADLKVNTTSPVVYTVNLAKEIKKFESIVLSDGARDRIYNYLSSINVGDKESRNKHIKDIHEKKNVVQFNNVSSTCPKCGSNLVLRNGKYGSFKGCSNYPSCKYTLKTK